jgi:hypothetical protein
MQCRWIPAFVVCLFAFGCTEPNNNTTIELMDGFQSRTTVGEIQKLLTNLSLDWEIKSEGTIPEQNKMPSVNIIELRIRKYSDAGVEGQLLLGFFDNKLTSITFEPNVWDSYQYILDHRFNKKVQVGDELKMANNLRVRIGQDYQGKKYVSWADAELSDEALNRSASQH